MLAKRLATVDVLSRGRMRLLTVGVGNLPGEAEAVGVDYRSRGRRADEAIDVLRLLWAGAAPEHAAPPKAGDPLARSAYFGGFRHIRDSSPLTM